MNQSNRTNRPKMRTRACAEYSGLSESWLTKARVFGGGPAYSKVAGAVIYDPDDVDAWLAQHRRLSTSVAA